MKQKSKLDRVLGVLGFAYIVAYQYGYVKGVGAATDQFNKTQRTIDRKLRMVR